MEKSIVKLRKEKVLEFKYGNQVLVMKESGKMTTRAEKVA